jgi:hypothetical protein
MRLHVFRFLGVALLLGSAVFAQDANDIARRDSTAALVRVACDPAVPVDLRAFKQRQLKRRQAYLERTISEMSADSLANANAYTADDRKDFTDTLEYLRDDLAEVREFVSGGCSSAPSAKPASVKNAVSDAFATTSASAPSVPQQQARTTSDSVAPSGTSNTAQLKHVVATPEGSPTDRSAALQNPKAVPPAESKPEPSKDGTQPSAAPGGQNILMRS